MTDVTIRGGTRPVLAVEMIGPWRTIKPLRRDGQGEVLLVERTGSAGQALGVLKRVPRDVSGDEKRLARFKHEIQVVRELHHPFIAEVLDTNLSDEIWCVTRFAPLGSLLDNVAWFKGDAWRVLRMGRDIATALLTAHEKKVIHRDVKPGNILLYAPDHFALTDFGIAHHPDHTAVTDKGEKVGPGWFLPPEAEHGRDDNLEPSPTHDVYMLGKLLYFTLTGGRTFLRERFAEGAANVEKIFVRPDFAVINKLFSQTIAEDPAKRFQTMDAVIAGIDASLAHIYGRRDRDPSSCRVCESGRYEDHGELTWPPPTELYLGPKRALRDHKPHMLACNVCGDVRMRFTNRAPLVE